MGGINNNIIIILGSCINSTGIIVIVIIIHVLPGAVCRKRARIELTQRRERERKSFGEMKTFLFVVVDF